MIVRPVPPNDVFTRAELHRCGWSDGAITRAVRANRLVRVRRGRLTTPARAAAAIDRAAVDSCRGSVLSLLSALEHHGLPVVGRRPSRPQLTVVPGGTGSHTGAELHRAALPDRDVLEVAGLRVTSVARTLVDVARRAPLTTAVAATDAALHRGSVTFDELDRVIVACWNWPGIRRVHRVIREADGRSESPLESVSRLVLGWLRLPVPELQAWVSDGDGVRRGRLDFYWDEFGVAGEADGRAKYVDRDVLTAEKERQEAIEDLGVTFARWGWDDTTRPRLLSARIERAFRRGATRDRSGLPRGWSIQPTKPITHRET